MITQITLILMVLKPTALEVGSTQKPDQGTEANLNSDNKGIEILSTGRVIIDTTTAAKSAKRLGELGFWKDCAYGMGIGLSCKDTTKLRH